MRNRPPTFLRIAETAELLPLAHQHPSFRRPIRAESATFHRSRTHVLVPMSSCLRGAASSGYLVSDCDAGTSRLIAFNPFCFARSRLDHFPSMIRWIALGAFTGLTPRVVRVPPSKKVRMSAERCSSLGLIHGFIKECCE